MIRFVLFSQSDLAVYEELLEIVDGNK
jgi:hypothetical protein